VAARGLGRDRKEGRPDPELDEGEGNAQVFIFNCYITLRSVLDHAALLIPPRKRKKPTNSAAFMEMK
jgi:hypothetical protein